MNPGFEGKLDLGPIWFLDAYSIRYFMSFLCVVCTTPFLSVLSCYFFVLLPCSFSLVHCIFFFAFCFHLCSYASSQWFGKWDRRSPLYWCGFMEEFVSWTCSLGCLYRQWICTHTAACWKLASEKPLPPPTKRWQKLWTVEQISFFQLQGCQFFPSKQGCLFRLQTTCKKEII